MRLNEAQKEAAATITQGIKGAISWLCACLFVGVLLSALAGAAVNHFGSRDSSDTADERSNLHVRTDALTGCQYLETANGSITPRIDSHGTPICQGGAQ